jgi:BioD-like phosphotransacetylase family protein
MKPIVLASTRRSAGKTSVTLGLAKALNKSCGYMKPLGDRLLYRKKRLWDYDAALVTAVLGLGDNTEAITIGFERAKLRFTYTPDDLRVKLQDLAAVTGEGKDVLFVEAGADLARGVSVGLDAATVARTLGARLVVVASGSDDEVVDDLAFLEARVDLAGADLAGVVVNKVLDVEDFKATHLPELSRLGIKVLGVLPHVPMLTHVSVRYLADALFARVVAGEQGMDHRVETVFVGAMSADAAMRSPQFQKPRKLIITSGDRADIVLAALEGDTAAVVLAHNILPPPNIVSMASERGIPLLMVPADTFQAAKQVDDMEALVVREETDKIDAVAKMVAANVDLAAL